MKTLRTLLLIVVSVVMTGTALAQEKITDRMQQPAVGKGNVTITQPDALYQLIGTIGKPGASPTKARGYRVQVYAGNNTRASREAAFRAGDAIRKAFPDLSIYTEFISPRWVCRVGDCRTYEEADALMRDIRALGNFKDATILPNQAIKINY